MPRGIKSDAELDLFTAVERGEVMTQVALKQRVGVSVGLINALVKRAVNKGYVKVRQAPYRRYAYYLTPQGFGEKSRLVAKYLESSLSFFRKAREQYAEIFRQAGESGVEKLVLVGEGELAEIALLAAYGQPVSIQAVVGEEAASRRCHGVPVVADLSQAGAHDGVVITDARDPQKTYERLRQSSPEARIFAPSLLHIAPDRLGLVAATRRMDGAS